MKAVRHHEYGGPEVLRYEDVEDPVPAAGEVRIRVAGASFNPVDDGIRGGWLKDAFPIQFPYTPGIEVSGTIDAVGDDVRDAHVGDDVIAYLPIVDGGAAAELVIASADTVAPAPASIPLADASALPMVALTAYQALFGQAELQDGQRILINGAGGTVGGYAVQLAKRAGAYVIATASARSAERVRAAGADEVIDHATGDLAAGEPVDVLLNLARIEPAVMTALTARVRDGGVVVNSVPAVANPGDEARGVRGVPIFVQSDTTQLRELVALVDEGKLTVAVDERLPLAELPSVHAKEAAGELRGKVVVTP